jgi:hypothetical protein
MKNKTRGENITKKKYMFQCIMSYEADTEEEARLELQHDLKHNGNSLFDCLPRNQNNPRGELNG